MRRTQINDIKPDDKEVIQAVSAFDTVTWKEPTESFKELCKQRAQQLRASYDYIILSFSGGSDSTTVLNAFLDNNIHIDEILMVTYDIPHAPCVNGDKAHSDLIAKNYTGIINKVTIQYSDIVNYLKNDKALTDGPNFSGQLHAVLRYNANQLEQYGFTSPRKRKGIICNLFGEQDPDVVKMSDKYYARFSIKNEFIAPGESVNTRFFTDITFPKLHVKQCFEVAKYMYVNPHVKDNYKICVRDCYSPKISPRKFSDNPNSFVENLTSYTEAVETLKYCLKIDPDFKDLYVNSVFKQQFVIYDKIKFLNESTFKYHLLELGT